jgi:hypothetical protein
MSHIIHSQGLWEVVPSSIVGRFDIITAESSDFICLGAKREDAALLVFSSSMFALLCFWSDAVDRGAGKKELKELAQITREIIEKANDSEKMRYGSIDSKKDKA